MNKIKTIISLTFNLIGLYKSARYQYNKAKHAPYTLPITAYTAWKKACSKHIQQSTLPEYGKCSEHEYFSQL